MVVGALLRVNVLRRVGCEGRRVTTRPERPQPLPRGGKTAVWIWVAERLHNHSMIGTSLWVPARPGHWLGTREKKRKASRAAGVRSQARRSLGRGPCLISFGRSEEDADQEAQGRSSGANRWLCYGTQTGGLHQLFEDCRTHGGNPVTLGQVASSPS